MSFKKMSVDRAQIIGLQALGWLVAQDDLLAMFMGASGVSRDDFIDAAQKTSLLVAVLDFILLDDAWVIAFCDSIGLEYPALRVALMHLDGSKEVHWT